MNPELEKLRAAIEEYLSLGEDTPVAAEAQALLESIDGESAGEPAMEPPTEGLEEEIPMDDPMPPAQPNAKSFKEANVGALDRLQKLNKRQG